MRPSECPFCHSAALPPPPRCSAESPPVRRLLCLRSQLDHTDENFRKLPTRQQRQLLLKEKEALSTGSEVREVINLLLHERQSNPQVLLHYANALETLTLETSNHQPMLQKTYVQQLVGIANEASGPTQAAALRAIYNCLEAEAADDIHRLLLRAPMNVAPTLMRAAYTGHEATQIEICRIVRALGRHEVNAAKLVQQKHHTAEGQVPFLEVVGIMLQAASLDLQVGAQAPRAVGAGLQLLSRSTISRHSTHSPHSLPPPPPISSTHIPRLLPSLLLPSRHALPLPLPTLGPRALSTRRSRSALRSSPTPRARRLRSAERGSSARLFSCRSHPTLRWSMPQALSSRRSLKSSCMFSASCVDALAFQRAAGVCGGLIERRGCDGRVGVVAGDGLAHRGLWGGGREVAAHAHASERLDIRAHPLFRFPDPT